MNLQKNTWLNLNSTYFEKKNSFSEVTLTLTKNIVFCIDIFTSWQDRKEIQTLTRIYMLLGAQYVLGWQIGHTL